MDIKELYQNLSEFMGKEVTLEGWIRNHRKQAHFGFIDFFDGTNFKSVQVVYEEDLPNFEEITKFHIGSAIEVKGLVVQSQGKGQAFEVKATQVTLLGDCPEDYPIQPKRHTREFLREVAHLRQELTYSKRFLELEV